MKTPKIVWAWLRMMFWTVAALIFDIVYWISDHLGTWAEALSLATGLAQNERLDSVPGTGGREEQPVGDV